MGPNDLHLTGPEFTANTYTNKVLDDMRYRIIEDNSLLLKPGVDWQLVLGGGFQIIKPGYVVGADSRFVVQFY